MRRIWIPILLLTALPVSAQGHRNYIGMDLQEKGACGIQVAGKPQDPDWFERLIGDANKTHIFPLSDLALEDQETLEECANRAVREVAKIGTVRKLFSFGFQTAPGPVLIEKILFDYWGDGFRLHGELVSPKAKIPGAERYCSYRVSGLETGGIPFFRNRLISRTDFRKEPTLPLCLELGLAEKSHLGTVEPGWAWPEMTMNHVKNPGVEIEVDEIELKYGDPIYSFEGKIQQAD